MSCFNCIKCISCCGLGCGLISSIGDIFKGIQTVKQDVIESIENKFKPKQLYFSHKQGDLYEDLKDGDIVQITFFSANTIEKSSSL